MEDTIAGIRKKNLDNMETGKANSLILKSL